GSGDYINTLKSLAQNLNIQDKILFTGYVSQERKVKLLQKAYLSIYPSLIEGWGLVNIEANACGTPVVASNVPGLRDSVNIGRSGLLYEYGNLKDLADKVIYLLKDRERYNGFVKDSIEWASTFWWKNTGKETLNYIESIIK
ncbi:glycosyltransferase family 4 protein, partial [candidate division WOR-3 bacterium]|nr:glycosyltransferase family 4 protein [candidate division WOR-3 bacterium]